MSINKFIIFGSGRCGTTMMCSSLKQHPEIRVFGEIFNRHAKSIDKSLFIEPYTGDIVDAETHKRFCKKEVCTKAHKKYDAFKLLFGHVHNDVEEYLSETNVVLLLRNPFKTAVSSLVADMTRVYCGKDSFRGTIKIDPQNMEDRINKTLENVEYYKRYSDLTIKYEEDFRDNYNKVCDLANISRFTPEVITKVRITRPMSEVIENYREVEHFDTEYDI